MWILVWALDFLHLARLALGPNQPPVRLVQDLFAVGKSARAGPSRPVLGWNFGGCVSLVCMETTPWAEWSGVRILVGTKIFMFSKTSRHVLGPRSLPFKGYSFFPRLRSLGCEVSHWNPSNYEVKIQLYLCSSSVPSWYAYSDLLQAGWSGNWILVWALHYLHQSRMALGPPSFLYSGFRISFQGLKLPGH